MSLLAGNEQMQTPPAIGCEHFVAAHVPATGNTLEASRFSCASNALMVPATGTTSYIQHWPPQTIHTAVPNLFCYRL